MPVRVGPQPGPQDEFLGSSADWVFYGGEAGGGKTAGLVLEGLRNYDVPGFGGIIFRRTTGELSGPQSLWELLCMWAPALGARLTQDPFLARWPSGASLQLDGLELDKDKYKHQGLGYGWVGFDELTRFLESQVWYLWSRVRSMSGVRGYLRATMNPDPDSWVKKMIEWYLDERGQYVLPERSGVIRYFYRIDDTLQWGDSAEELKQRYPYMIDEDTGAPVEPISFTFIRARLSDNRLMRAADPGYRARLMSMPKVERERLLSGDWLIRPAAGLYFQRGWFRIIEEAPLDLIMVVRAYDKAASQATPENPEPAWTRGVKMGITRAGRFVVLDVASIRGSPHQVDNLLLNTATQDGTTVKVGFWRDPGQAGVVDEVHTKEVLRGFWVEFEIARKDKITYAGPYSTQVEASNVDLVRGPWNDEYMSELQGFPDAKLKDQVDASSRAFMMLHKSAAVAYQAAMQAIAEELQSG